MTLDLSDGQWLEARFVEGRTVIDVASELGVTPRTVRNAAHRHGVILPQRRTRRQRRALLEDVELLRVFRDDGLTVTEIADRAGATTAEVRVVLAAHGVVGRDRRLRHVDAETVRQLLNDGCSFRQIAVELGASPKTVREVAANLGVRSWHVQHRASELRDRAWLRHEYIDSGRSLADIGREVGVAARTVRAALDRMSIPARPTQHADIATIRRLMGAGQTIREVADATGVSSETIRRHAIQLGLHTPHASRSRPELRDTLWLRSNYVTGCRETFEIAAELGVADQAVRAALRRVGIPLRIVLVSARTTGRVGIDNR